MWGMVLLLSGCVGSAYAFIEEGIDGSDMDREDPNHNRVASVFSAFLLFTGCCFVFLVRPAASGI